jgi:hypothetical protein
MASTLNISINDLPKDILHLILTFVDLNEKVLAYTFKKKWSSIDLLEKCWRCSSKKRNCTHISSSERHPLHDLRLVCKHWNNLFKTRYSHYTYL